MRQPRHGGHAASLPGDAIILAMIAGATPKGAVVPIEEDGIDGAGGALGKLQAISALAQVLTRPIGEVFPQEQLTRLGLVIAERTTHLKAVDICRFTSLLDIHVKFHHIQKELEQVLILAVTALDGKG